MNAVLSIYGTNLLQLTSTTATFLIDDQLAHDVLMTLSFRSCNLTRIVDHPSASQSNHAPTCKNDFCQRPVKIITDYHRFNYMM